MLFELFSSKWPLRRSKPCEKQSSPSHQSQYLHFCWSFSFSHFFCHNSFPEPQLHCSCTAQLSRGSAVQGWPPAAYIFIVIIVLKIKQSLAVQFSCMPDQYKATGKFCSPSKISTYQVEGLLHFHMSFMIWSCRNLRSWFLGWTDLDSWWALADQAAWHGHMTWLKFGGPQSQCQRSRAQAQAVPHKPRFSSTLLGHSTPLNLYQQPTKGKGIPFIKHHERLGEVPWSVL